MALIKCPDCGNDCSDTAMSCPKCGHPFTIALDSEYETRVIRVRVHSYKQKKFDNKLKKYIDPDWEVMSVVDNGIAFPLGTGHIYVVTIRRRKADKLE